MDSNDRVQSILARQVHGLAQVPSARPSLYSYATPHDKLIILISFFCAILGGVLNPLISVRLRLNLLPGESALFFH